MRFENNERLTSVGQGKRSWIGYVVAVVVLAAGPENLARIVSLATSTVTFPLTGQISAAGNSYEVFNLELLIIYIVAVLGLNLLAQAGILSIGQIAPFAIGAYTVAITTVDHNWSFYPAFVLAAVLTGALGALLALPSLRLGVFAFAMVTLGYTMVTQDLSLQWAGLTHGGSGLLGITMPKPFDDQSSYYWLVVGVAVIAFLCVRNYLRSPGGRAGAAAALSPTAARSAGLNVEATKLRASGLAWLFGGAAGALYAPLLGFIAPDSITIDLAILFLLMVLLGGSGTVVGPILGAIVLFRLPLSVEHVTNNAGYWSLLIYGAVLLASVHFFPRGIMSGWHRLVRRVHKKPKAMRPELRDDYSIEKLLPDVPASAGPVLEVRGVAKTMGGVRALRGVDLEVEPGTIHALIGPNGSGKTTLQNVVCGFAAPDAGTILLRGQNVANEAVHRRARRGLARTFQVPNVFEGLSCCENVMLALDARRRYGWPSYVARLPGARREERRSYTRAAELLGALGLAGEFGTPVGQLPPGRRRMVEFARVLALEPAVVLMDEPAAGLTPNEITELEEALRALRNAGVAVLLVEHHFDMIVRLADTITVIDFGEVIAHGNPDQIQNDPAVVRAYLGDPVDYGPVAAELPGASPWESA